MVAIVISILSGVLVSVLSAIILAELKKSQETETKREKDREKRDYLVLKSLRALNNVSKELTRCVRGEKPNGELTEAFNEMIDCNKEVDDWITERASRQN